MLGYTGDVGRPCLAAIAVAFGVACSNGDVPPNLLLISIDTLRADRLVCYGGDAGAGLCGVFENGTRYRWAFSASSTTSPSIASLLTSQHPSDHGVENEMRSRLAVEAETIAETLRDAGYTTAAFVSNPLLAHRRRFGQGFGVYDDQMSRRERNRPHLIERDAAATTDAVLAWAKGEVGEPWFVWVHYQDPHGPYDPPATPPPRDPAGGERLPVLDRHSGKNGIPAYQVLPGVFTLPGYAAGYRAEIEHLDRHLVRLVRGLDARGRAPAILLTADHGEAFGEDGYFFAHGHSLGLDQIRVPLLMRTAGPSSRGRVVDEAVGGVDVAPTLLALAGVPVPEAYAGRTLPGSMAGAPEHAADRPVRAEHWLYTAEVRGARYRARARDPRAELPDREADLGAHDALPSYRATPRDDAAPMATPSAFR